MKREKNKAELYPHQVEKATALLKVLRKYHLAYLSGQTRSGKTATVLSTAEQFGAKRVLFISKKKALSSIQSDYELFGFDYELTLINYASVHKVEENDFDVVICDEHHSNSAYPKPSKRTKIIRKRFSHIPMILCTGTPATESYSQFYHQFWISEFSPFPEKNFYIWARKYVDVFQKQFGTHRVNDYSRAKEREISAVIEPYIVRMTRKEAGLEEEVTEHKIFIDTPEMIQKLADQVIKMRIVQGRMGRIEANTPASLASKCHQIYSGSVIIEDDQNERHSVILHDFKARAIKKQFGNAKIAIMYYFRAEWDIIKSVYGDDITDDLQEFKETGKSIALQFSTSEGMNLSEADAIVYFNLGFSGKDYLQSKQRLTVKGRKNSDIYYILERGGITQKVLKTVQNKQDYNSSHFMKDFVK